MLPRTIGIFLLAGFAALAASADLPAELKEQMEKYSKASAERNVSAMEALLADDCILITRTGATNTKKEYLDRMRASATPSADSRELLQSRLYGNTAVVTMKATFNGSSKGTVKTIVTTVWVKDQAGWKLVSTQNTILP